MNHYRISTTMRNINAYREALELPISEDRVQNRSVYHTIAKAWLTMEDEDGNMGEHLYIDMEMWVWCHYDWSWVKPEKLRPTSLQESLDRYIEYLQDEASEWVQEVINGQTKPVLMQGQIDTTTQEAYANAITSIFVSKCKLKEKQLAQSLIGVMKICFPEKEAILKQSYALYFPTLVK